MGTLHTHAMTPIDESNLYRKWCVPAALINALASVTLMSDDDVDELAGERWVERPCFARPLEGARELSAATSSPSRYEIGWATKTLASDGFPEAMKFLAARLGCSPGSSQR